MNDTTDPRYEPWTDAILAAALLAVDPVGLGGASLRSLAGPARAAWLEHFADLLPTGSPILRMPLHVTPDRLLGGLDLTATLATGRPVIETGLLARADGGAVVAAMAERLERSNAALLCGAMDLGEVRLEREGTTRRLPARFAVIALDEGLEPDEYPPEALLDRVAFRLALNDLRPREANPFSLDRGMITSARALLGRVQAAPELHAQLTHTAAALGIDSLRAVLFALRAARAAAALSGETTISELDATLGARLVLAPRATRLPAAEEEPAAEDEPPPEPPAESGEDQAPEDDGEREQQAPEDVVLEAVKAAIPAGLLEQLRLGELRTRSRTAGGAGERTQARGRGRPIGVRAAKPEPGKPLNVIATLRAAAPWQRVRGREPQPATEGRAEPVAVRGDDFRVTRFRHRAETVTIFAVDASGSAAMQRLAEAKGAVELLLSDCYVRRDQVALIAFRGADAELLLPPTRSLVRAKRSLAGLPGGGGTPLAIGIDAAAALADQVRRRGQTPAVVILTDGRANIGRSGKPGRKQAHEDALTAGRALAELGCATIVIDSAPRPQRATREIAEALGARYLPLPFADAGVVSRAVAGGLA